jgi:type I restriction enzyme S subunit
MREGYKNTEVGVIPEDWDVKEFQDVMEGFSSGQTPYRGRPEFYKGDILWITSGELNYNVITDTVEKITTEGAREANLKMIPKGTFLFAITGLEAAGTRGSCAITGIEATTNQSCMALYPKRGLLNTSYLFHYYVRYGNELAFRYCQGTKQQSYTGGIAKKLPIIVPPSLAEQTAIATALSDADALINSLSTLIAKKRNIKQGALQKCLNPDFQDLHDDPDLKKSSNQDNHKNQASDKWEVKEIGGEIDLLTGFPFSSDKYSASGIKLLRGSNIKRGVTDWNEEITQFWDEISPNLKPYILKENDIVIAMDGSLVGRSFAQLGAQDLPALLLQRVARVRSTKIDMGYLKEFICSEFFTKHCDSVKTSSAIPHISPQDIRKFKIPIPPTKQEQTRIATILSDMDAEIQALESKLEKYRKINLGMMQNLLTGKIRLI